MHFIVLNMRHFLTHRKIGFTLLIWKNDNEKKKQHLTSFYHTLWFYVYGTGVRTWWFNLYGRPLRPLHEAWDWSWPTWLFVYFMILTRLELVSRMDNNVNNLLLWLLITCTLCTYKGEPFPFHARYSHSNPTQFVYFLKYYRIKSSKPRITPI